jgi:hypothetical protein
VCKKQGIIAQQNAPNFLASFDATPSPHKRFNAASLLLAFSTSMARHQESVDDKCIFLDWFRFWNDLMITRFLSGFFLIFFFLSLD